MTGLALRAGAPGPTFPTLSDFGHDPWWLVIIKVLAVFLFLLLGTLFAIWAERRVLGQMQSRPGPNRAGPFGLLQSLMDGIKLALKEDIVPRGVDKVLFWTAPAISVIPAFISIAVIPFGPMVSIAGVRTPLQVTDLPVAVLLVLAMSSMGVYGIVLAGWSSTSPYALLGGLRSSAQVISYEIAMGLSFVPVFLYAGSLSTARSCPPRRTAPSSTCSVRAALPVLVRRAAAAVVRDLPDHDGRRDQPDTVRPARGRGRAGRRLPHRVLVAEVRDAAAGRVRQRHHRLRAGDHAVPRRLAGAVADLGLVAVRTPAGGRCCGS